MAQNDVQIFFEALADAFPLSADLDDLGRMWRRFIEVVGRICVIFFPQYSIYLSHRLRWLK